jgi:hypothetical protein
MTRPPTDREALIAALAEQARGEAAGEPEPGELLDYLAGLLPPEAEQRVGRQLAASPEASRALLDLADLETAGAAAGTQPAELAARAGWRDLQSKLPAPRPWFRRSPILSSVAAALLVTTVGLSVRLAQSQGELSRPVANLARLELASGSRAAEEPVAALPPGAPVLLLLAPAARCPAYTAELEGPIKGDRHTLRLKPDKLGRLTALLPGRPGEYRLSLTGCEPPRPLEEHRFRITAEDG